MAEHTKLPLRHMPDPQPIHGDEGMFVAGDHLVFPAAGAGPLALVSADHAAFIVKAVNAYPDLVEALKTAREWIRIDNGNTDPLANQLIAKLDDALAKAEASQ